ncbi:DUF2771 domain-containing protein [Corynebacterium alimapuense]|uniref:DUF2771 domain-containing protein n=1 Tax=Corynebacterium alimapuense TaxID=1576874 RepID=A0A3M8K5Y9_9CORY|nr:DUF2771 domain-containing protein [Corynebacterium alimapuense]RNE48647.1 DUF2771 domain-containing protein [Corynebacterium alimapuense]
MATRKQARQKSLLQILALLIAVVIVIVTAVLMQNWWNDRPGPQPEEVSITATVGEESVEILPYLVCEPGTDCPEGEVPNLSVGEDDTLVLQIPEEIHDHDWQILKIYDDPAVNDQQYHGSFDTTEVEIAGSVDPIEEGDPRPRLVVVEISSVMIGINDDGEENPYATIWSLNTI